MFKRFLYLTCLAGLVIPQATLAQNNWPCGPTRSDSRLTAEDSVLAARYAPIYWYGPGERYFPTVPFFTAFDGVDNNGNGTTDFADSLEIAPSWETLDSLYLDDDDRGTQRIGRSAILFRVCDLTRKDIADMWRYVRSDEQAWHRFDIDANVLARLRQRAETDDDGAVVEPGTEFRVIQYYAFALADYGLQGHRYDSELVYVFLPKDEDLAEQFRIVVGGGHTDRVPNNVLILSGESARRQSGLNARPSILVELGDHSSSPDMPPYGNFAPGLDANWHNYDLWGTRDVQASSGLGALGPYRAWMTFPRNPSVATRLFPPVLADSTARRMTAIQFGDDEDITPYSLLPVEPFADLFARLAKTDSPPTPDQVREIESAMTRIVQLAHRRWRRGAGTRFADGFHGFDNLTEQQKIAAVRHMKKWFEPPNPLGIHYVWETAHYTQVPSRIFKQHLFRPSLGAMDFPGDYLRQLNFSVAWQPSAIFLQAGWDVAAFWLPIRIQGYLSLQGGVYTRCADLRGVCFDDISPAFSMIHTGHYSALLSWYMRASWVPRKAEVDGAIDVSDWLLGGGLALAMSKFVRVRVGLASELRHRSPLLGTTVFEGQIVVQPFHRRLAAGTVERDESNPAR